VIRFGVVLTVVLAAMGLLAGGVLANSLPLVYLAIGAAALAALMLTAGVLIWREEVFGPSPASREGQAARSAVGPSPVLAATGAAPTGWSAGGRGDDAAANGAAAPDDFVVEPPPPALPPHPDWPARQGPQGYPDWPAPPQQQPDWVQLSEQQPSGRPDQPDRAKRSDRAAREAQPDRVRSSDRNGVDGPSTPIQGGGWAIDRPEQQEQPDWLQRSDRPEPQEQPDSVKSSDRADRVKPSDQPERQDRPDRAGPSERPERPEQPGSVKPSDRPERQEHLEPRRAAEPAARQGAVRRERASRSPGVWPEPPAEPVPGPRRGDEPASGGGPPAVPGGAAAGDELPRRLPREPTARSRGERDPDVPSWSFFSKAAKPSAARPDVTEDVGAETGAARPGESGGPAETRKPAETGGPGGSRERGGGREPDESPKAAHAAEATTPDVARPPDSGTAEGGDRAAAAPDAARSGTRPAAGRDRAAAGLAERDAPAEPAQPEPASAAAEEAAPKDAGPEAQNEPPAGTATGSATRDGHPARGLDTEVTVVPGITRYHRSQCILIRFLGPEDLETMTLQAAEMASYIPCKACRPDQVLAGD
jgi:hypothetical protein